MTDVWVEILRLVRRYPSPHNSQPIKLRVVDDHRVELYYDLDRGLPAEPFGIPFGHVCAGIFVELFAIAAHAQGFTVAERLRHDAFDFDSSDRLHLLGTLTLVPADGVVDDLDAALISRRRTSRLPYLPRTVDVAVVAELDAEARRWGHRMVATTDDTLAADVVEINQRTLFDDLRNPAVRHELAAWLRYTADEAARRGDGLSAECLHLPGPVLRWFIEQHRLWSRPVLGAIARRLYLRSMCGVRQVAWITGRFVTVDDFIRAGRMFIRCWLRLTAHGVAVQPLGSMITNPRSRAALVAAVGEPEEGDDMTWMLLRIGYSAEPPRSHRLPAGDLLLGEREPERTVGPATAGGLT
ncbi:hypothetical protein BH23ACT10_BH23ACT10_34810 [soil metagenome]